MMDRTRHKRIRVTRKPNEIRLKKNIRKMKLDVFDHDLEAILSKGVIRFEDQKQTKVIVF